MEAGKNIKRKVLIIEDELDMLDALEDKFSSSGFLVLKARNGAEGLDLALREHPDAIILDIVMPKMDGLAMLKKLKEDSWGNFAPVIVLTNLSDNEKLAEALEIGIVEYLIKSEVKLGEIVHKVRKIMGI